MKIWIKRAIIGVLSAIAIVMIAGYMFLDAAFSGMCGNEVFAQVVSPDKQHKAVLFQRDCGATTGFSTQISIIKISDELDNEGGNILIADEHPDKNNFEMAWVNPSTLLVSNTNNVRTFKKENTLEKIAIHYE